MTVELTQEGIKGRGIYYDFPHGRNVARFAQRHGFQLARYADCIRVWFNASWEAADKARDKYQAFRGGYYEIEEER